MKAFLEESLKREHEARLKEAQDLTPPEMLWRPGPQANPIGWILWHVTRVEDFWIQFFIQQKLELWEREGWHQKFNLPTRDNGFGHTPEQVAQFPALDLKELLANGDAVRQGTVEYLHTLSPDQFESVPRQRRPEMTVGAVFLQITGEFYQHLGHIAYLKGLLRSQGK